MSEEEKHEDMSFKGDSNKDEPKEGPTITLMVKCGQCGNNMSPVLDHGSASEIITTVFSCPDKHQSTTIVRIDKF